MIIRDVVGVEVEEVAGEGAGVALVLETKGPAVTARNADVGEAVVGWEVAVVVAAVAAAAAEDARSPLPTPRMRMTSQV